MSARRLKLVTREERASEAARVWAKQYGVVPGTAQFLAEWATQPPHLLEIYKRLIALGPNPSPDSVDEATGNQSWTSRWCSGCGLLPQRFVLIDGQHCPGTALCEDCLKAALAMLEVAEAAT
jgi:hypothetical protein